VVRGLKKYEKREKLKEKEFRRVKERILKNF
jgi:tmRNA-binding protein